MEGYREGEIITLRFSEDRFIPGKIIQVEPLTLHDIVHVRLYDMLVEGGPGGYDPAGDYRDRVHNLPEGITSHTTLFDSLAMTSTAFEDSDPVIVAFEEVREEELGGYSVWVARRRASAERRGMIRYDVDDLDEEGEDPELQSDEDPELSAEIDEANAAEDEFVEIAVRPWHETVYDIPLSAILRDLSETLTEEPYDRTEIGQALTRRLEEGESEIDAIVERLVVDGDYAAGQELLDFGDRAVPSLSSALARSEETQTVEDICQILADMGTDASYEALSKGMENRIDRLSESESARAAARSWLYAVMLTGGTPDPLRERLTLMERMNHPELADDLESALKAVQEGGVEAPTGETRKSSDPFGM